MGYDLKLSPLIGFFLKLKTDKMKVLKNCASSCFLVNSFGDIPNVIKFHVHKTVPLYSFMVAPLIFRSNSKKRQCIVCVCLHKQITSSRCILYV